MYVNLASGKDAAQRMLYIALDVLSKRRGLIVTAR